MNNFKLTINLFAEETLFEYFATVHVCSVYICNSHLDLKSTFRTFPLQ